MDRVELAYLRYLLREDAPLFAIVRGAGWYWLLDHAGTQAFHQRFIGARDWGAPSWPMRLRRKLHPEQRAAYSYIDRIALDKTRSDPKTLLLKHFPEGPCWINTGHSNLTPKMFDAVAHGRSVVMIHDLIPLDFPQYQRPGTVEKFREKVTLTVQNADLVLCNSRATEARVQDFARSIGQKIETVSAHLGIEKPCPDPAQIPPGLPLNRPYFVTLGTIEPRKDHALLLDTWEHLAQTIPDEEMPVLFIIGARGWANEQVFARLDTSDLMGKHVFELGALPDGAAFALLQNARALLFPSRAEGFGLPPAESLALGTPVIARDLPVYREVFGNNPIYLPESDMYSWGNKIRELSQNQRAKQAGLPIGADGLPSWQEHINLVLRNLCELKSRL